MRAEFYSFSNNDDCLFFEFDSVSDVKTVKKIITYTPFPNNSKLYNIALGDFLDNGEISDISISNNSDMRKVIATVIQTMFCFFRRYPGYLLFIIGSTPERTRLYRIIILQELFEAKKYFEIYGIIVSEIEPFSQNRAYESFVITLR